VFFLPAFFFWGGGGQIIASLLISNINKISQVKQFFTLLTVYETMNFVINDT
jgi:hypothetical protein